MQEIKRRPPHHLRRLHYWSLGLVFGGQFFLIAVSFASICTGYSLSLYLSAGIPVVTAIISIIISYRFGRQYKSIRDEPFCESCGYLLVDNEGGTCPECGTLDVFHLRVAAARRRHALAGGNIFRIDLPRSLRRRVMVVMGLVAVATLIVVVCAAMVIANPERQSWAAASFGVASLICLAAGVLALLGWRSYLALRERPFCESCGHSLVETDDATCAECGSPTADGLTPSAMTLDVDA